MQNKADTAGQSAYQKLLEDLPRTGPGTRAGEMSTDRTIANCAMAQHATAIQKIASASDNDMM